MRFVRLPRNSLYGNVGSQFTEVVPADEAYLFPPEATKDVWSHGKSMADYLGYAFYFDAEGNCQLQTKNNPTRTVDLEPITIADIGSPSLEIHPNAYAGTYLEFTGTVPAIDIEVKAARIDVVFPLGPSFGAWTATVFDGVTPVGGPFTITPTADEEIHFYDQRNNVDLTNATVATLFSGFYGEYTIRLQSSGGAATRRLDALMLWAVDPQQPLWPAAMSTNENTLRVQTTSANDDQRNHVTIVGTRIAAVTDSEKLGSSLNNPAHEFVTFGATDVPSIANPYLEDDTTPNPTWRGGHREAVIYDRRITDRDMAGYVGRTFIYRYRLPPPQATLTHTLLPPVQLRDPVNVVEETYNTTDANTRRYVTRIRHNMEFGSDFKALTDLETSTFPEYPSYEPREDVDIDRFNPNPVTGVGDPVLNVVVDYVGLDNQPCSNVAPSAVHKTDREDIVSAIISATSSHVSLAGYDWPPVPGTLYLSAQDTSVNFTDTELRSDTQEVRSGGSFPTFNLQDPSPNLPVVSCVVTYRDPETQQLTDLTVASSKSVAESSNGSGFWYEIDVDNDLLTVFRTSLKSKSTVPPVGSEQFVTLHYLRGPAGWHPNRLTNSPYHHFFEVNYSAQALELYWKQADGTSGYARPNQYFLLEYRRLGPVDGGGVFQDPYGGASPFYDPYTSELGNLIRVKFDALVTGNYRISVRSVYDDTIVAWLTNAGSDPEQPEGHWQYLTAGTDREFFWDSVDQLGDWNARQSAQYAAFATGAFPAEERPAVGKGFYVWNREEANGELALISGQRESGGTGKPVFGHGTFAEWYVLIEATNDHLEEIAEEGNLPAIRTHSSRDDARVYTHLPHATRVEIDYADWVAPAPFDPTSDDIDVTSNWLTRASMGEAGTSSADAVINNRKPVRIRFNMRTRPGIMWENQASQQSVKLFRTAHLRRNCMDQFVLFEGVNYPGKTIEQRKVVSRRSSNDDHTFVFADASYRLGKSLKTVDGGPGVEWIFRPENCKKDFRGTGEESLAFADYLQLDEVPGWAAQALLSGRRSRFQVAFVNDIFYLSVFTQDRSGRYQWCLNPYFLDRSKIMKNEVNDWHPDADGVKRPNKWPDDSLLQHRRTVICRQWTDEYVQEQPYSTYMTSLWGLGALGRALTRHYWADHTPTATQIGSGANQINWSGAGSADQHSLWHKSAHKDNDGRLPASFPTDRQLDTALGTWNWETNPYWIPSVTRDFHGYYCIPPMVDPGRYKKRGMVVESSLTGSVLPNPIRWASTNFYAVVYAVDNFNEIILDPDTTAEDAAMFTVWQSPTQDMTETYSSGDSGKVRFHSGASITSDDTVDSKSLDYMRQDSLVHFEDLRGMYTRGPKPQEQPKKLDSIGPYYQNVFTYGAMSVWRSKTLDEDQTFRKNQGIIPPVYEANINDFFMMTFRTEYVWESAGLFPVTDNGREDLNGMNARLSRLPSQHISKVRFDSGAWTGWKDEYNYGPGALLYTIYRNIFDIKYMPVAPSTRLPQTTRMVFHLTLVDERRGS